MEESEKEREVEEGDSLARDRGRWKGVKKRGRWKKMRG